MILPEADDSNILTVWLALTDATAETRCLAVVPRSHKELMPYCPGRLQLVIPEQFTRPAEVVPSPVKRGGALLMHLRTMHSSIPSCGENIRWSFDLRYNPIGQPTGRPARVSGLRHPQPPQSGKRIARCIDLDNNVAGVTEQPGQRRDASLQPLDERPTRVRVAARGIAAPRSSSSSATAVTERLVTAGIRVCPIWIAPEWVLEAAGPLRLDAAEWIDQANAAGIGSLLIIAKQHDGRCIWPSAQPSLRTAHDFLGELCSAAQAAGPKMFVYYSVAIDADQVARHPDWAFVDRHGQGCYDIGFQWACVNSPYRGFVLAQIEELLRDYPIESLWLDILALGPVGRDCVCQWCRQRYAERHGGQLESVIGTPAMGRWKIDCLEEVLGAVVDLRDRFRPEALIAFNGAGAGFRRHPEAGPDGQRLFGYVDFLSDEGHQPHYESAISKAMRAHGKAFEVLTSNGLANEWVGWVPKPASLLSLEGAIVGSHGGSFGLGVSVLPDGQLPAGELAVVSQTTAFLKERRAWFGAQRAVADVWLLIQPFVSSEAYVPPEQPRLGARLARPAGTHHVAALVDSGAIANGLWDALREQHVVVDFVHEHGELGEAGSVLVLGANTWLSDGLSARIREFVAGGGYLLAEGHAGLLDEVGGRRADFALADVFGVHFAGYAGAWDANYIGLDEPMLGDGLPELPLLVTGPALRLRLAGAQALAHLIPPLGGEQTMEHHTASLFNPPGRPSSYPAIVEQQYGRGRAMYVGMAVGEYLRARRNIDAWAKRLVRNLVHRLMRGAELLETDAPAGVELVVNEAADGRLLVHLLNQYVASEHVDTGAGPVLAPIRLELNERRLGEITRAWIAPPLTNVTISRQRPGWATVLVPDLAIHKVVVLERQRSHFNLDGEPGDR